MHYASFYYWKYEQRDSLFIKYPRWHRWRTLSWEYFRMFRAAYADFLSSPCQMRKRKKETESEQGERQRKRNMGSVYAVILCALLHRPLPSLLRDLLTRLRLWLSGQEVQQGGPPPHCYPHPISAVIDLSSGSLWRPLFWRSWVCELILDSDGDHFLFLPLFDRTPVSRYIDCYSLVKISEF
jgi:hypothetical protein